MRVLVVEDERDLNRIICKKLKVEGYSVDACYDGEEALLYIDGATYDIILMDIMMPKLNGYEVLEKMRREKNSTPVLFLTAKDAIEDRVKGLDLGADDYIVKPFHYLRIKMDKDFEPKLIHTIRGVGYVLKDKESNL